MQSFLQFYVIEKKYRTKKWMYIFKTKMNEDFFNLEKIKTGANDRQRILRLYT